MVKIKIESYHLRKHSASRNRKPTDSNVNREFVLPKIKNLGMGCYCIESEVEQQRFPHDHKEAATAPDMQPVFKKEDWKLAPASG